MAAQNTVYVDVVANDGTKMSYSISVFRRGSSFAEFCNIELYDKQSSLIPITPAFDQNSFEYSGSVGSTIDGVIFRAQASGNVHLYINDQVSNENLTDAWSQVVVLKYGDNTIKVSAVADDKRYHKDYYFIVHRILPSNLCLQNISLSNGTLIPTFSSQTQKYSNYLLTDLSAITITPTASSSNSVIFLNDNPITSGQAATLQIPYSSADAVIKVVNGGESADYKIRISKPAMLSNLIVTSGQSSSNLLLEPTFSGRVKTYRVWLSNVENTISIQPIKVNSQDLVEINGVDMTSSTYLATLLNKVEKFFITVKNASRDESYILQVYQPFENVIPKVSFVSGQSEGFENIASQKIKVALSHAPTQTVTINYAIIGGTATGGGVDYSLANGILTFSPCESEKEIPLSIIDDNFIENDETVQIRLSNALPSGKVELGSTVTHVYKIIDNDYPSVSFALTNSQVYENVNSKTIQINLSQNPVKPVRISYSVKGGSATYGLDYIISGNIIEFNPGDPLTKNINASIINDMLFEGNETAILELVSIENAKYGSITKHTLTIVDDDQPFVVEFVATSGSGVESQEWVQIPVAINRLHTISEAPVTVDYTVTGVNGAVAGTDFVLANGQLTWGFCSGGCGTIADITMQILNDNEIDPGEQVLITLSNPVNAVLENNTSFVYSIIDDEPATVRIVYVDWTNGADDATHNGSTWALAKKTLQAGLQEAALLNPTEPSPVEVWVAAIPDQSNPGQFLAYKPGTVGQQNVSFSPDANIHIYGGFAGTENSRNQRNWENNLTILSGDLVGDDNMAVGVWDPTRNNGENSYHVITLMTDNIVIDGFVIEAGIGAPNWYAAPAGGAINIGRCDYAHLNNIAVRNCKFKANMSTQGGAINSLCAKVNILNCHFSGNHAKLLAGSTPTGVGGAVNLTDANHSIIDGCIFENNSAESQGGAFSAYNASSLSSPIQIRNTIFINNQSWGSGGALALLDNCIPEIFNSTFVNNSASLLGGVLYTTERPTYIRGPQPNFVDCILWGNNAGWGGTSVYSEVIDNPENKSQVRFSFCDIEGMTLGTACGGDPCTFVQGNIDANPLFVTGSKGDYYLEHAGIMGGQTNSPCINAGSKSAIDAGMSNKTTRVDNYFDIGTVDMGYHY